MWRDPTERPCLRPSLRPSLPLAAWLFHLPGVYLCCEVLCKSLRDLSLDLPQCSWNVLLILAHSTVPLPPA